MTSTTSKSGIGTILTIILAFVAFAAFGDLINKNRSIGIQRESERNISLRVNWGPQRDLTIIYWIDDQRIIVPGTIHKHPWEIQFKARPGQLIELTVEQHNVPGLLLCVIRQDDVIVDWESRNDLGDCNVSHIVM